MEKTGSSATGKRFEEHVARVQEIFTTSGLPFGKPNDVASLASSLGRSGRVRDDLVALVRTMSSPEGHRISRAEIVSILVVAAGGGDLYAATREIDVLPRLRAFVDATLEAGGPAAMPGLARSPELHRDPPRRRVGLWLAAGAVLLLVPFATILWRHRSAAPASSAVASVPAAVPTEPLPPATEAPGTQPVRPTPEDNAPAGLERQPNIKTPRRDASSPNGVLPHAPSQGLAASKLQRPGVISAPPTKSPRNPSSPRTAPLPAQTPSGTAPPSANASSGGFLVSSGVMGRNLLSAPVPPYPKMARAWGIEGQVILQAVISSKGQVLTARALDGHRLLRGAAEKAVRTWRYKPRIVNGKPTDVATVVIVDFRLHP